MNDNNLRSTENHSASKPDPSEGNGSQEPGVYASVMTLFGVGTSLAAKLKSLGIVSIYDLLYHLPRKYLDRSNVSSIASVKAGEDVTVVGRVCNIEARQTRTGKHMLVVDIYDGTGYLSGVWFNQPYHAQRLKKETEVAFSGKTDFMYGRLQIVNPDYDILESPGGSSVAEQVHTGRIVPVYPCTAGVSSAMLRRLVSRALRYVSGLFDPVPKSVRVRFKIPSIEKALTQIHFPETPEDLKQAWRRVVFEEIFLLQVGLAYKKRHRQRSTPGIAHCPPDGLVDCFLQSLPFELTSAQKRCWKEIVADMTAGYPMNRLLQGEVASGKTVLAVLALLLTVENGYQGSIMAPTEVLVSQHTERIGKMLADLPVRIEMLTKNSPRSLLEEIASGDVDIVIGTHALIQENVKFRKLGLVVVDEQHRFGIRQRFLLTTKGRAPDVLHMSATPIPRTLALTLYGDLDVSTVDEVPSGRKGVLTIVADESQRSAVLARVRTEIARGRQAFVICPLIEDSENLEAKAVEAAAKFLRVSLPDFRIAVLHGQMKSEDKNRVMKMFEAGKIDILVSTVLVEVGIDIPNATIMIVENAERFGLAQLHQLRGRVGRGVDRGLFILFAEPSSEEAKARLEAICKYSDGFSLAEADLMIRGEGTLFGMRQSGISDMRFVKASRNVDLIRKTRQVAFEIVDADPLMRTPFNVKLLEEVKRRFAKKIDWLFVA